MGSGSRGSRLRLQGFGAAGRVQGLKRSVSFSSGLSLLASGCWQLATIRMFELATIGVVKGLHKKYFQIVIEGFFRCDGCYVLKELKR